MNKLTYHKVLSYTFSTIPEPYNDNFILRQGYLPRKLGGNKVIIVDKGEYNGDNVGNGVLVWTTR